MITSSEGSGRAGPPSNPPECLTERLLSARQARQYWSGKSHSKRRGRMPIIDAQVHLWRKGTPTPLHLATPYLVEDAIRGMDEAGVDGAILHPPTSWDPDSNEQAVEAVLAYPTRFAILGYPALDKADSASLIATWKQRPGMLGLRLYFNQPHNRSWPMAGTLDWPWPAPEQAELPVALLAGDWLPLLGQIAARHPRMKLAVDHMGRPRGP